MSIKVIDVLDAIDHRSRQVHEGEMGLWVRASEWDIVREAMRHSQSEAKGLPEVYATLRGIPEAMESAVFVDPRMQYWADQIRKAVNLASPPASEESK